MRNSSLGLIGLNHKVAPVEIREKLTLLPKQQPQFFAEAGSALNGFAVLSTCNRVEFYGHSHEQGQATKRLQSLLHRTFDLRSVESYLYRKQAREVPHHLMRVACGLDSMILGESQILGQVQSSLFSAESASLASSELKTMFQAAVKAGRRARTETALGQFPVSIASVAIDRIFDKVGPLNGLHVAVLGTGEMGSIAGKILRKKETAQLTFINRNYERAKALAVDACAQAVPIEDLRHAISQADVVISATDAPHIILGMEHISPRINRPLLLVDLAVPRDIDPFLNELSNVTLLDIDHLKTDITQSKTAREAEIPQVEKIIETELDLLNQRLQTLELEPVITDLRQKAESIRQTELSRILKELGPLDTQMTDQLDHFSNTLINKLLHEPTLRLRHGITELDPTSIRKLFGLDESASDQ